MNVRRAEDFRLLSATTLLEPRGRPPRRFSHANNGITINDDPHVDAFELVASFVHWFGLGRRTFAQRDSGANTGRRNAWLELWATMGGPTALLR
jgi:hypothetical protein